MASLRSLFNWFFRNGNTLIFTVLLSITFYLFSMSIIESNFFFGILGSLISLYLGIGRYQLNHDKMFMELFNEFNSRYDDELNDLFNQIHNNEIAELNNQQRLHLIDYLNLCSEEYYWYRKGRIPSEVWKAWKAAIESNLNHPIVEGVIEKEFKDFENSYYGLSKGINVKSEKLKF